MYPTGAAAEHLAGLFREQSEPFQKTSYTLTFFWGRI